MLTLLKKVLSPQQLLSNSPSFPRTRIPSPRTSLMMVPLRSHAQYGKFI